MSGGSYDYLYIKDPEELFCEWRLEHLEQMRDRLLSMGDEALDAAGQTDAVIGTIRAALGLVAMRQKALYDVWRAVEWWDSGDSGEDRVREKLKEYRAHREDTP